MGYANIGFLNAEMYGKGYGMPSSHAQFVSFFSVYLTLFLLLRHKPHPTNTHTPLAFWERALLSVVAIVSAAAVAVSRIYLNYHTPKQVLVGCGAGVFCAVFWFGVTTYLRRSGWLDWALDQRPARQLRMRDLVVTEDLMDAGWARWDQTRRKKKTAATKKKR
jgi:dolichyldiphosphatase